MLGRILGAARGGLGVLTDAAAEAAGAATTATGALVGSASVALAGGASTLTGAAGAAMDMLDAAQDRLEAEVANRIVDTRLAIASGVSGTEGFISDVVWSVRRPAEKATALAVGAVSKAAPIVATRAIEKALDRLFGGLDVPPMAPLFAAIGVIEALVELQTFVDEMQELAEDKTRRLDADEAAMLADRRLRAETRLKAACASGQPFSFSSGFIAAVFDPAIDRYDAVVLAGTHTGRSLAELSAEEVVALRNEAPDAYSKRTISSWAAWSLARSTPGPS